MKAPSKFSSVNFKYEGKSLSFQAAKEEFSHREIERRQNFLESDLLEDARRFLKPGDIIIDAGAHIGNHTLFFSAICDCTVIAFEPDATNFASLKRTVTHNKMSKRVELHNAALGSHESMGRIKRSANTSASMLGVARAADGDINIHALDEIIPPDHKISLIKMDIEGSELRALKGAEALLKKWHPRLYIECLTLDEFETIYNYLKPFGYSVEGCLCTAPTFAFSRVGDFNPTGDPTAFAAAAIAQRDTKKDRINALRDELNTTKLRLKEINEARKLAVEERKQAQADQRQALRDAKADHRQVLQDTKAAQKLAVADLKTIITATKQDRNVAVAERKDALRDLKIEQETSRIYREELEKTQERVKVRFDKLKARFKAPKS